MPITLSCSRPVHPSYRLLITCSALLTVQLLRLEFLPAEFAGSEQSVRAVHSVITMPSGKSRAVHSGSKRHKSQKRHVRGKFMARHIDQVFADFEKPDEDVHDGRHGPLGSTSKCAGSPHMPCLLHSLPALHCTPRRVYALQPKDTM